jgi:uracil-DNA glycosylase
MTEFDETMAELAAATRCPGALCPEDVLALARRCIRVCRACPRAGGGAQPVPGSGPASARLMIVGGEPTPEVDGATGPFAGEAGDVIRDALRRAGLGIHDVYLTLAVKHRAAAITEFPEDVARTASLSETDPVLACRRLLEAEIAAVKPEVVLCLGAVAARALLGRDVDLPAERGARFHPGFVPVVMMTVDPGYILAHPSGDQRARELNRLVVELHDVAELLGVSDPFKGRDELAQL